MAQDCSYFRSSKAFTTDCMPYCTADGSGLLIIPLVKGFHDGLRAVLHSGWQQIAHSSACQWLSWFARCFAKRIAVDCSIFRSSTSIIRGWFAYRIPQRMTADCSFFHTSRLARWFSRCITQQMARQIAHSFARQWFSRWFAGRIAQRMAADCSYFRSLNAFTTDCALYCSADGSGLLILPLVNGFHGLRAVLLSELQRIAQSSARRRLLSRAGSRTVLHSGWQRIAHTSARQRLSRRIARCIAPQMAADCS